MQVRATFLLVAACLLASTESSPHFSNYLFNNYEYPATHISAQPQYLQYQNAYTPYYFYNLQTDAKAVPTTFFGKPAITEIPTYNFYYQPPVYDFRFPLNPVYPVLKPQQPGLLPKPIAPTTMTPAATTMPTTTIKPKEEEEDDAIEKLDMKLEPESEKKNKKPAESSPAESDEDDSIAVEAI